MEEVEVGLSFVEEQGSQEQGLQDTTNKDNLSLRTSHSKQIPDKIKKDSG